jgi:hypothetical protein
MTKPESPRRKKARGLLLRHGYAVGGHVKQAIAEAVHAHERHDHKGKKLTKLKRGGAAEGDEPTGRADKPRRAAGGRNKKAGTKVIIVNAGHGSPQPVPVPVPRPVPVPAAGAPAAAPPVPGPGPAMPGAPVPGAPPGVRPMPGARPPMAKRGRRIKEQGAAPSPAPKGVGMTVGSKTALGRLQKMRAYGHR